MHLALVPIVLGRGERLWDGLEGVALFWLIVLAQGKDPV